ncbi:MAG TPA: hypothetical protein VM285_05515 [Polyangia bacterium]|nr:hypothetical protein [Polyangia bacterium]
MSYNWTNVTGAVAGVADGYLNSVDMKVGAYTLDAAAPTFGARHVTCTRTVVDVADTPGTIVLVGVGVDGRATTETLTPGAHTILVTGTKFFRSLTSATGVGWVIGGTDEDTIVIGWDNVNVVAVGQGVLHGIHINVLGASAIYVADARGKIANIPASQAAGSLFLWDINFTGYLRVEPAAAASDITVLHTGSMPASYAL